MLTIFRYQFRAQIRDGAGPAIIQALSAEKNQIDSELLRDAVLFLKIYQFGNQIFVYLESELQISTLNLPKSISDLLCTWPGKIQIRKSVPMMDIFHDGIPRTDAVWRASDVPRKSIGSIIYLRPEKYCSYVFYHFQLQEEGLRKFNKYYLIGAHENCLFSYQEVPAEIDSSNIGSILTTNNSPENWAELMGQHFQPWQEEAGIEIAWKAMDEIYAYLAVPRY